MRIRAGRMAVACATSEPNCSASRRLADSQALGEVVQAQTDRDHERQCSAGCERCGSDRNRAGSAGLRGSLDARKARAHAPVEVDEAHEADGQAAKE